MLLQNFSTFIYHIIYGLISMKFTNCLTLNTHNIHKYLILRLFLVLSKKNIMLRNMFLVGITKKFGS